MNFQHYKHDTCFIQFPTSIQMEKDKSDNDRW